jgi:hypothetical protein
MEEEGGTTSCGLGSWRPSWLQSLASRQAYTAIYSLLGIVQGMGFSYLSAVLSTIEKQFGIRSKETAGVFSGNEISQICFIFALPFLSKIHRRTLWTSVAMVLTAFGLFLCASPFFAKDKTAYDDGWNISGQEKLCTGGGKLPSKECNGIRDFFGMAVIFLGFFITGIGTSFFYSFGIPYITTMSRRTPRLQFLASCWALEHWAPALATSWAVPASSCTWLQAERLALLRGTTVGSEPGGLASLW